MDLKKHKKWIFVAALVAVFCAWGTIRFLTPATNDTQAAKMPGLKGGSRELSVITYIVKPSDMNDRLLISGRLIPDEEVDLQFETSGKITALNFKEGSMVKKGDLLGKVNDNKLQAELKRLEARLPLAEARVFRQGELLGHEAVSREALEVVTSELEALKAEIDNVKAQIANTELRAPFDGKIGLRLLSPGAYASPGAVVARLTKLIPLKVEFSVPERYASEIHKGTKLDFKVDGILDAFPASVYAVESSIDPNTHTLTVRALYPNQQGELTPGRYAHVELKARELPDALAIPSEAIVPEMGINRVYLYRDGKAEPVDVEIGIRTDKEVQIVRGLNPGDTIITSGTLQLRKGMPVAIQQIN